MEETIRTALLIIWVCAALALISGHTGRTVWLMAGVAAAFFAYGGYLLFAGANGGMEL